MFIGLSDGAMFQQLRSKIDPGWFAHLGAYELHDRVGHECKLTVGFQLDDGKETGFVFKYGSQSQGPPGDVCGFVEAAVSITNPWYEKQKAMVKVNAVTPPAYPAPSANPPTTKKPWWKFW